MLSALPVVLWAATVVMNLQTPLAASSLPEVGEGLSEVLGRFELATIAPLERDTKLELDPAAGHLRVFGQPQQRDLIMERLRASALVSLMDIDAQGVLHVWVRDSGVEALAVPGSNGQPAQLVVGRRRLAQPLRRRWLGVAGCVDSMRGAPTVSGSLHVLCARQEDGVQTLDAQARAQLTDMERTRDQLAMLELQGAAPGEFMRWRERRPSSLMGHYWLAVALTHGERDELELCLAALRELSSYESWASLARGLGASVLERALVASLDVEHHARLVRLSAQYKSWMEPEMSWAPAVALALRRAGEPQAALALYQQLLMAPRAAEDNTLRLRLSAAYATASLEAGQGDRAYFIALYVQEQSPLMSLDDSFLKSVGTSTKPCKRPACTPGLLEQRLSSSLPQYFEGFSHLRWAGQPWVVR